VVCSVAECPFRVRAILKSKLGCVEAAVLNGERTAHFGLMPSNRCSINIHQFFARNRSKGHSIFLEVDAIQGLTAFLRLSAVLEGTPRDFMPHYLTVKSWIDTYSTARLQQPRPGHPA